MKWIAEIELRNDGGLFYAQDSDLGIVPEKGIGIYVFCRRHGKSYEPIYVGSSKRLRKRLIENLNSVSPMRAVRDRDAGGRVILVALALKQRGRDSESVARLVEDHLIKKFQADGFELVNDKGTKRDTREISWRGTNAYLQLVPRAMFI
jgi:hypothetical protein